MNHTNDNSPGQYWLSRSKNKVGLLTICPRALQSEAQPTLSPGQPILMASLCLVGGKLEYPEQKRKKKQKQPMHLQQDLNPSTCETGQLEA